MDEVGYGCVESGRGRCAERSLRAINPMRATLHRRQAVVNLQGIGRNPQMIQAGLWCKNRNAAARRAWYTIHVVFRELSMEL